MQREAQLLTRSSSKSMLSRIEKEMIGEAVKGSIRGIKTGRMLVGGRTETITIEKIDTIRKEIMEIKGETVRDIMIAYIPNKDLNKEIGKK